MPPQKINLSSCEKAKHLLEGTSNNLIVLSQEAEINLVSSEFHAKEDIK